MGTAVLKGFTCLHYPGDAQHGGSTNGVGNSEFFNEL